MSPTGPLTVTTDLPPIEDPKHGRLHSRLHVVKREVDKPQSSATRAAAFTAWEVLLVDATDELGPMHPFTLEMRAALEIALSKFGERTHQDSAEALASLQRDCEAVFPRRHPTLADVRRNRAQHERKAGHVAKGIALYEEELRYNTDDFGPDDYRTSMARNNLVIALTEVGTADALTRARELALQEIDIRTRTRGEDHANTWVARLTFAEVLLESAEAEPEACRADAEEALTISREIATRRRDRLGPNALSTLNARRCAARALILLDRCEEAFWTLAPLLEWERLVPPKNPGETQYHLARALTGTTGPEDRDLACHYARESQRLREAYANARDLEASRRLVARLCPDDSSRTPAS